jgi:hypothetical protein
MAVPNIRTKAILVQKFQAVASIKWLRLKLNYSSNPTQWVRFSMLPRFCASSIFCVIQ